MGKKINTILSSKNLLYWTYEGDPMGWDRAGIELATPVSAVRHASVARHITDCATRPGKNHMAEWHSFNIGQPDNLCIFLLFQGSVV